MKTKRITLDVRNRPAGEVFADLAKQSGLKLDYTPRKIAVPEEFGKLAGMTCGRRHYVLWSDKNQLLVWGKVLSEKAQSEADGFGLHFGDSLFDGGRIRDLSMKYGIFGALIEH